MWKDFRWGMTVEDGPPGQGLIGLFLLLQTNNRLGTTLCQPLSWLSRKLGAVCVNFPRGVAANGVSRIVD